MSKQNLILFILVVTILVDLTVAFSPYNRKSWYSNEERDEPPRRRLDSPEDDSDDDDRNPMNSWVFPPWHPMSRYNNRRQPYQSDSFGRAIKRGSPLKRKTDNKIWKIVKAVQKEIVDDVCSKNECTNKDADAEVKVKGYTQDIDGSNNVFIATLTVDNTDYSVKIRQSKNKRISLDSVSAPLHKRAYY